jgi:cytoplasmic tRNA 2-thiolation protein 1
MPRLQRCTAITTGQEASPSSSSTAASATTTSTGSCKRSAANEADYLEGEEEALDNLLPKTIKRSKPFKYVYEKEIVMYAYFKVGSFPYRVF